jgi:hypothetical protein
VDTVTWTVSGLSITHTYPSETAEGQLTPTITLSPGATVSPASGVEQNFFTAEGVKYTVTAQNGTTKEYTVKATRTQYSGCEILSFKVGTVTWTVSGTDITHTYPSETVEGPLTPTITLSPGATVSPASGVEQDGFFTEAGVTYTVTAQDGTTKTYIARAIKAPYQRILDSDGYLPVNNLPFREQGKYEELAVPWRGYIGGLTSKFGALVYKVTVTNSGKMKIVDQASDRNMFFEVATRKDLADSGEVDIHASVDGMLEFEATPGTYYIFGILNAFPEWGYGDIDALTTIDYDIEITCE